MSHVFIHLNFTVHEKGLVTLLDVFVILVVVFLIHVRVGGGECRVDILGLSLVLSSFSSLEAHNVCLLERAILV